jgi:glycosyltransferase involved in cell wall biosynthesis
VVRVLYVTDRLSMRGGADQHLLQVIDSTVANGAEVTVACGRVEGEVHVPGGVEVVRVRGLESQVPAAHHLDGLEELVSDCDAIHAQNVMNPVPLQRTVETGRVIVTIQDHRVFCPGMGRSLPDGGRCSVPMSDRACAVCLTDERYRDRVLALTRARLQALDGARIIALSQYMAAELEAAGLADIEVVPPWIDIGPPRDSAGDGFLVGGRMVSHKAPKDAVRAWELARSGLPLRVAGAGPLESELVNTELLGWIAPQRLRKQLRRARALLFPSFWQEPFGILGIQALAEGTPVIVADSGGTADWSDAGCIRVPPGDVASMADAIRQLEENPDRALELGRRGREMVAERFARSVIEPRLLGLYVSRLPGRTGWLSRLESS